MGLTFEPQALPEIVVDRILASIVATSTPEAPVAASEPSGDTSDATRAMLAMRMKSNNDSTKCAYGWACRIVDHNLSDAEGIAAFRAAEREQPLLKHFSDAEITKRIRDAERDGVVRGSAVNTVHKVEGRTDSANARRFAARYRGRVRYLASRDKWLLWDDQRWREDDRHEIEALAKELMRELWNEVPKASEDNRRSIIQFATKSNTYAGVNAMLKLSRSEPGIAVSPDELDSDAFKFNCANGTVDLRTGELKAHDPSDLITKLCPVVYDPKAECPTWLAVLNKVLGDDSELIDFFWRLLGYFLTGDVREQVLAIFWGRGANGKSTIINVLLEILGDYGVKCAESLLLESRGDQHPTAIADLHGRRLAIVSETTNGAKMAESRLKELTGGETLAARKMREDYWRFKPSHKLLLGTNYKPSIAGTDYAIWRRILLIAFGVTIPPDQQDKALGDKLRAEYSGVLSWMIAGCLAWQRDGLKAPSYVVTATEEYRSAEDTFSAFLEACCAIEPGASASASELLKAYQTFSGDHTMNPRRLSQVLADAGFSRQKVTSGPRRGRMAYTGLRILLDDEHVECGAYKPISALR